MSLVSPDVIEVEALKALHGIDCGTARCASNAQGTGRLVRSRLLDRTRWVLEVYCPDCKSETRVSSRVVDALVAALEPATAARREKIAAAWVAERRGKCHPWSP